MQEVDDIQTIASELRKKGFRGKSLSSVLILTVDDEAIGFMGAGNSALEDCERIYWAVGRWLEICKMRGRATTTILCTIPEHNGLSADVPPEDKGEGE